MASKPEYPNWISSEAPATFDGMKFAEDYMIECGVITAPWETCRQTIMLTTHNNPLTDPDQIARLHAGLQKAIERGPDQSRAMISRNVGHNIQNIYYLLINTGPLGSDACHYSPERVALPS